MRRSMLLLLVLLVPLSTYAVLIPIRGEEVQLSASPEFPVPGTSVTMTAHVSLESLGKTILWTVDGDYLTEGVGLTSITIPIGTVGSQTEIEATIMEDGEILGTRLYIVRPTEVDLVWEGQTYVPPLYMGRPLANANANVVVVASPRVVRSGTEVPSRELNFTWEVNGSVVTNKSGYGKSSLTIKPVRYSEPLTVSVLVETGDGLYRAEGSANIPPVRPRALVYEDRPLTGVNFNKTVSGGIALTGDEITFRTYPFFSATDDELTYRWKFNGEPIALDTDDPRVATFRRTGEGTGTFSVEVAFENLKLLFERGASAFDLSI